MSNTLGSCLLQSRQSPLFAMHAGPPLCGKLAKSTSFTFDIKDIPTATLHFTALPTRPVQSFKRRRSVCDVDGEGCSPVQKKKRRLRLNLITSRLSQPYATPSTFIGSQGSSKAAKWARLRRIGKISLRKAALVNWTRMRNAAAMNKRPGPPPAVEVGKLTIRDGDEGVMRGNVRPKDAPRVPAVRSVYAPSRPSPLGLSNYQALDLEGDPFDEDNDWNDTDDDINSDFNIREPEDELHHVGESPSLDPNSPLFELSNSSSPSSIWSVLADENMQHEVSLATFHSILPS